MTVTEFAVIVGLGVNVIAIVIAILKVGQAIGEFRAIGLQQAQEIKELKHATAKLGDIVTDIAVQTTRQDNLEKQHVILQQQLEDLRRGDGFILNPSFGPSRGSQT